MIKRTLFFRMMIDALDALSEKCGKLLDPHIEADLTGLFDEAIAEAQLEAIERYESLYDCTFRADYECGENVQTGRSFIAQKSYLAELRKAAEKGKQ